MPYRYSKVLLLALGILANTGALAEKPLKGQEISDLTINKYGELVMDVALDDVVYKPWSTHSFKTVPQMHAVLYFAATFGASRINTSFSEALESLEDTEYGPFIRPTTLMNVSEAGWGGPEIVLGQMTYEKRRNPERVIIADSNGQSLEAWELAPGSSAVIVLDQHGTVLFFGEGELNDSQFNEAINLLTDGAAAIKNRQ